jgi:glycosyltransferase EpsF
MSHERPVRVLQVVDNLGMGGAETWLMEVLRLWARGSVAEVDFLVTGGKRGLFDDEATELGSRLHYVRYGRGRLRAFAAGFRHLLRRGQYDAIHDHQDYTSGWHFAIGAGLLPQVRVTHVHNPAYQILNNYGVSARRRLTARVGKALVHRCATHIAGTSRQVLAEYGFGEDARRSVPVAPIYCGFEPARFRAGKTEAALSVRREFGWSANTKVILFAGRMDRSPDPGDAQNHKNSGFAVSVALECARRDPTCCMLLAGAPQVAAASVLQRRVLDAGFGARIRFLGVRRDIERLMLGTDVLLFPSRGEGLGMVAVEAQAAGLPVLASRAVPVEVVVVPQLVRFQALEAGVDHWASDVLELAGQHPDHAAANARVAASPFAIQHSARALLRLYTEGVLN